MGTQGLTSGSYWPLRCASRCPLWQVRMWCKPAGCKHLVKFFMDARAHTSSPKVPVTAGLQPVLKQ